MKYVPVDDLRIEVRYNFWASDCLVCALPSAHTSPYLTSEAVKIGMIEKAIDYSGRIVALWFIDDDGRYPIATYGVTWGLRYYQD